MQKRAIFLDRDGVINAAHIINGKPYPPQNILALRLLPQVADALHSFKKQGYKLIVVTNQPDVARGNNSFANVTEINKYLMQNLPLDAIKVCWHGDDHSCQCRKPKPGLLLEAAQEYNIDLQNSYMVGDRWRDIDAGNLAGCRTFWIDCQYQEQQPDNYDWRVQSLYQVSLLINGEKNAVTK